MSAARLLADARAAGVQLWRDGERVRWRGAPPAGLIDQLRTHKCDLIELLRGDRCRSCDERMAWPGPAGVMFADGTAECQRCTDAKAARLYAAARRAVAGVVGVSDEGEFLRADDRP